MPRYYSFHRQSSRKSSNLSPNFSSSKSCSSHIANRPLIPRPAHISHNMAKDKSGDPEDVARKEKKDKKEKKRKHSEVEEVEVIAERKKDKKDKKRKSTDVDGDVVMDAGAGAELAVVKDESDDEKKVVVKDEVPLAALVPFANPLCDEKAQKKVLKSVKKGNEPYYVLSGYCGLIFNISAAKHKSIKRGVKECVKAIRKSPLATPTKPAGTLPTGIVILAADISPMDVISHIPVLCEDHDIPYVYVPSRAELGAAGSTKRPTSVVMLTPKAGKGEADEEWDGVYKDVHKLAMKLGQHVKV